jgi:hypothetical protein
VLAISIPRNETAVIKHFQERMPYAPFVPEDLPWPFRRKVLVRSSAARGKGNHTSLVPLGDPLAGHFKKLIAKVLVVSQASEPNAFGCVVLGGPCEVKAFLVGGHREAIFGGDHG